MPTYQFSEEVLEVTDDSLIIHRAGSRWVIPTPAVSGVRHIAPKKFSAGYLQIMMFGVDPGPLPRWNSKDENAVSVRKEHVATAAALAAWLESLATHNRNGETAQGWDAVGENRELSAWERKHFDKLNEREQERLLMARLGPRIHKDFVGLKSVSIYQNGYVKVRGRYEELVSIEMSGDIAKKTGAGRAAGAVLTGGLNLYGSNMRGDLYVTIVTAQDVHVLHDAQPDAASIKRYRRLEAIGNSVAGRACESEVTSEPEQLLVPEPELTSYPAPAIAPVDLAGQLTSLANLHTNGVLSDEEFRSAKARLLG